MSLRMVLLDLFLLPDELEPAALLEQAFSCFGRSRRRGVYWYVLDPQLLHDLIDLRSADPARDDGLLEVPLLLDEFDHGPDIFPRPRDPGVNTDHYERIDVRVREHDAPRRVVPVKSCVSCHVQRVPRSGDGRQVRQQCVDGLLGEVEDLESNGFPPVCGHASGPATVRYYSYSVTQCGRLVCKSSRIVEQFDDVVCPLDMHLSECTI